MPKKQIIQQTIKEIIRKMESQGCKRRNTRMVYSKKGL